jgi:hypothetical protein
MNKSLGLFSKLIEGLKFDENPDYSMLKSIISEARE